MPESSPESLEGAAFEQILDFLRQSRGFDFTAYKRASLMRRMRKRMDAVGIRDFDEYLDYLQVRPDEFPALFNTILINVTRFFRDPDVWQAVTETVLPALLTDRSADAPLRIWIAGTASGEEAYTVAMLLADQMGPRASADGSRSTRPTWTSRRSPKRGRRRTRRNKSPKCPRRCAPATSSAPANA
jgi:chemotaxis methyl-accepting protein methylase